MGILRDVSGSLGSQVALSFCFGVGVSFSESGILSVKGVQTCRQLDTAAKQTSAFSKMMNTAQLPGFLGI